MLANYLKSSIGFDSKMSLPPGTNNYEASTKKEMSHEKTKEMGKASDIDIGKALDKSHGNESDEKIDLVNATDKDTHDTDAILTVTSIKEAHK